MEQNPASEAYRLIMQQLPRIMIYFHNFVSFIENIMKLT